MFSDDAIIFVDADSLFFKICCVTQKKSEIRKAIKYSVNTIKRDCMTDNILLAVKGRGNFRSLLYPPYKANRPELEEHVRVALNYAHSYMVEHMDAVPANGMEADDLVSIWANEARETDREFVVAGIDKDLLQIEGCHYNYNKQTTQYIDKDTGHLNLMRQCLTGDSTDNIPGLKGIGPVKANKILDGVQMSDRWTKVCATWEEKKAGSPHTSWRLLKMLESFNEHEDIMNEIALKSETSKRKQDVLPEPKTEDSGVYSVPGRDKRSTPRQDRSVAVR